MPWQSHDVRNQFDDLTGYDLYTSDLALQAAVTCHGGSDHASLRDHGVAMGDADNYRLAEQANRFTPELRAFDARGRRTDVVEFHPSWHHWLAQARRHGLHASPFSGESPGRWIEWAARFYMHAQIESGSQCPTAMTLGCIPLLEREPALWSGLGERLLSRDYDATDRPVEQKSSIWIGMGMTEKQGGSDVRTNATTATPIGPGGRGGEYLLRGHKWFFSAPMCDAHLVVARAPDEGLACFYVPRWRPDGTRNAIEIQRLKNKVGNRSNSSSEVEFLDAWGMMIGEPGRGIPTIIEMATYTRLTCAISSAGFMRQAVVQAIAYARQREAFGRVLAAQPLMTTVLADMALESEAAMTLAMRLAAAYASDDASARAWRRIMTPAAKFWICKRAVELTGEAMEVFGGNGYVDDGIMARLFREAPVNSIWEGSGNVMCLDVLRAIAREPAQLFGLLDELERHADGDARLIAEAKALRARVSGPVDSLEAGARAFTARLVVLAQACLLRRDAPGFVADAFASTRLSRGWGHVSGCVDTEAFDAGKLLARALPQ